VRVTLAGGPLADFGASLVRVGQTGAVFGSPRGDVTSVANVNRKCLPLL